MWRAVALGRFAGPAVLAICAVGFLVDVAHGPVRAAPRAADERYLAPNGNPDGVAAPAAPTRAVTGSVRRPHSRTAVARPDQGLLTPPHEPNCEYKPAAVATTQSLTPADAAEAQRVKLDYERQCYRHAELIVRAKLKQVQSALAATGKSAQRR